jgi:hypothetical protein
MKVGITIGTIAAFALCGTFVFAQEAAKKAPPKPTPPKQFTCDTVANCRVIQDLQKRITDLESPRAEKACVVYRTYEHTSAEHMVWLVKMSQKAARESCQRIRLLYLSKTDIQGLPAPRFNAKLGCLSAIGELAEGTMAMPEPGGHMDDRVLPSGNLCNW